MPPATSPWTFLVPALGAFLGVVLAQWWTSRREKRQWERQMQMYATQWADQRERDAQQHTREDLHRFASERREVYARLLTALRGLRDEVKDLTREVNRAKQNGDERDPAVILGAERLQLSNDKFQSAILLHHEALLLASQNLAELMTDHLLVIARARGLLLLEDKIDDARVKLSEIKITTLLKAMRDDLAGKRPAS